METPNMVYTFIPRYLKLVFNILLYYHIFYIIDYFKMLQLYLDTILWFKSKDCFTPRIFRD